MGFEINDTGTGIDTGGRCVQCEVKLEEKVELRGRGERCRQQWEVSDVNSEVRSLGGVRCVDGVVHSK